jgi:hypothetical protein
MFHVRRMYGGFEYRRKPKEKRNSVSDTSSLVYQKVEKEGIEPATYRMRSDRSTN